ncbi:hypothetical protein Ae717Ps2_6428 [Pseudonocardia sp. Ae717_Ps2]|nr:hypothetical protein Ae717Ps2_6428 [Pseudonocardia sp. Ae717_Ps2]
MSICKLYDDSAVTSCQPNNDIAVEPSCRLDGQPLMSLIRRHTRLACRQTGGVLGGWVCGHVGALAPGRRGARNISARPAVELPRLAGPAAAVLPPGPT